MSKFIIFLLAFILNGCCSIMTRQCEQLCLKHKAVMEKIEITPNATVECICLRRK